MHRLASEQTLPLLLAGLLHTPVDLLQLPMLWQSSLAEHTTAPAPVHWPAWQVSVRVQASPSLQAVPCGALGLEQMPVATSQLPGTWH